MQILAQASFATGVRVMGEIGRVLDGTGEKRDHTPEESVIFDAISVIDFGP